MSTVHKATKRVKAIAAVGPIVLRETQINGVVNNDHSRPLHQFHHMCYNPASGGEGCSCEATRSDEV
eukprot:1152587-Pyramimonas_sp.AAC.2